MQTLPKFLSTLFFLFFYAMTLPSNIYAAPSILQILYGNDLQGKITPGG